MDLIALYRDWRFRRLLSRRSELRALVKEHSRQGAHEGRRDFYLKRLRSVQARIDAL